MQDFLERNLPPGYVCKTELLAVALAFCWTVLSSLIGFLNGYLNERQALYLRTGTELILDESRVMPDFVTILGDKLQIMIIFALLVLILPTAIHYAYYYSGGKSIYLMRRLPNGWELHRRSLFIPLLYALLFVITAVILFLIFYTVYMNFTPEACLMPGQWQKIWSVFQ